MNKTFTDLHNQALTLGDHIEQMREAYEALERERDALAAHVERLRKCLHTTYDLLAEYDAPTKQYDFKARVKCTIAAQKALASTPTQSLNHIEAQIAERQCSELAAQVEEETVSRYEEWEESVNGWNFYPFPYKYAKQEGSMVEEGE